MDGRYTATVTGHDETQDIALRNAFSSFIVTLRDTVSVNPPRRLRLVLPNELRPSTVVRGEGKKTPDACQSPRHRTQYTRKPLVKWTNNESGAGSPRAERVLSSEP